MDERQKEYAAAFFVVLYTAGIALAFANSGWWNSSDLDYYFSSQPPKHPVNFPQAYFLLSNSKASFAFASAFVPSLALAVFMRRYGRKASMLAAAAIPFVLIWQVMAQNFTLLFFTFALGTKGTWQKAFFLFGVLAHRYAWLMGAMILASFAFRFPAKWVRRGNMAVVALLIAFLALRLYQNCFIFEFVSRRFLLFSIPLCAVFVRSASPQRQLLFAMVAAVGIAGVLAGVADGFRVSLFLSPLSVIGIAESRSVPWWLIVALLLFGSALAIGDNWNSAKDVSHSAFISLDAIHIAAGISGQAPADCPGIVIDR